MRRKVPESRRLGDGQSPLRAYRDGNGTGDGYTTPYLPLGDKWWAPQSEYEDFMFYEDEEN